MAFNKGKDREEEIKQEELNKAAAEANIPVNVLAEALTKAMQGVMAGQPKVRTQVPFGMHSKATAFNPKGKANRPVKYRVFQNGYPVNPRTFFDEEIAMINSGMLKPGKYINSLVRVSITDEDTAEPALHFTYKNERADQRMALGSLLNGPDKTGFGRMCRLIITERAAMDVQAKKNLRKNIEDAMADDVAESVETDE